MNDAKVIKLLYMEDDPGIATLTRHALKQEGIAVSYTHLTLPTICSV